MTNDDVIKQKVKDFYTKQSLFTSINIANSIKKDGLWIRNRDVASWLRTNFEDVNAEMGDSYLTANIDVDNDSRNATLYYPFFADTSSYKDRNLKAVTPDEFEKMHGYRCTDAKADAAANSGANSGTKSTPAKSSTPAAKQAVIMPSREITETSQDRIRIPGAFIKAIGLNPGDLVSLKHDKIGLNIIPANLIVHADYRASIPRKNVTVGGKSVGKKPVHISLKDGKICFELTIKKKK